ncbi:transglycosylase SLT domain-containing protein [Streptomyces sp. NPDC087908]|uniref:aggregation-promoting factor C-terminal-like domain-containing protein n=1 Tax=unclassified Streptomyces TaxID=2593676 RepID=UPI0011CE6937|nr:transglycosylase SLT domain-containing protein [Streptomyces sp. adm13(2018)]MYS10866.1 transglycosylase SLT domain-containing protein [Streptomyces sp. SID6041]TXS13972.1 lytic transglycosylase domain-containing protein [Streptomyces sp. adm13(2018)]
MIRSITTRVAARKRTLAGTAAVLLAASGAVIGTTGSASAASPQDVARKIVPASQYASFSKIVEHESHWNHQATNSSSGAYGLVQALPASKMSSAGSDWKTNPATQIKWGLNYMNERYGSPNAAWAFWQANGWY